jgi:fructokinase
MEDQASEKTVISFGEILWDIFPYGNVLGGAPFNLAFRLNSLGEKGIIASRLGRDELGSKAYRQVLSLGLNPSCIQWDEHKPTGTVNVSFAPDGTHDFYIVPEVAYDNIEATDSLLEAAAGCDFFCFGTLVQRSPQAGKALEKLLEAAAKGKKFLDINLRKDCYSPETVKRSLARADILKLNDAEVVELALMLFEQDCSVPDFCEKILEKYSLESCLVTFGERGIFACSSLGEKMYVPGCRVEVADTVGCGDAFSAGFVHGTCQSQPLAEACRFGNLLGALAATSNGATAGISPEEIVSLSLGDTERIIDPEFERYLVQ